MRIKILMVTVTLATGYAWGDCFDDAARWQGVHPGVLRAISIQENKKCDGTVSRNRNGSVDIGCLQINSVHLPELANFSISESDLKNDQCKNIFVGAWIYKQMIQKYGNNWLAVGSYNSQTPRLRDRYAESVKTIFYKYHLDQNFSNEQPNINEVNYINVDLTNNTEILE